MKDVGSSRALRELWSEQTKGERHDALSAREWKDYRDLKTNGVVPRSRHWGWLCPTLRAPIGCSPQIVVAGGAKARDVRSAALPNPNPRENWNGRQEAEEPMWHRNEASRGCRGDPN